MRDSMCVCVAIYVGTETRISGELRKSTRETRERRTRMKERERERDGSP